MQSWYQNLDLLIRSRTPLIWIKSTEEERLVNILRKTCERLNKNRLVSWDCVNGIRGVLNQENNFKNNPLGILNWIKEQSSDNSTLLLLKDFHKYYEDPSVARTLKELSFRLKETTHNLIFNSHKYPSSGEFDNLMTIIDLPLPDQEELINLFKKIADTTNSNLQSNDLITLATASSGLSESSKASCGKSSYIKRENK